jgi:DNA-binding response OmpR family regulator
VEAGQCAMPITKPKNRELVRTILIVDDDTAILKVLARGFEFYGKKVFTAENGPDGWNLFMKEGMATVLTDIRMPGEFDGAALACRIRRQSPDSTIAVMTGGDGEIGGFLLEKGIADHFFTKPCSINHICKTLITDMPEPSSTE